MAINKPTTTDDLVAAVDGAPGAEVVDPNVPEPEAPAPKDDTKYVRLVSPTGSETMVPEGIADALKDSGYSEAKGKK